jgi:AcrR family transcriptional regulator
MVEVASENDRRTQRRAARRAENRTEILDAAELVFGSAGIHEGSLRAIAAESGFSPAAIYLFFENKQHLLAETITRRGDDLNNLLAETAASCPAPLESLHRIVDATIGFFTANPNFRLLLSHLRGGVTIAGPLDKYAPEVDARFGVATDLLTGIVTAGQKRGEIRAGDARTLARLYMVLVNEYVYLSAESTSSGHANAGLSAKQFHDLVDDALSKAVPRRR